MKFKLFIIVIAISVTVLNVASYFIIKKYYDASMYSDGYQDQKDKFIKTPNNSTFLHPYYGMAKTDWKGVDGMMTGEPLFYSISGSADQKDVVKVLILGGSVASHLSKKNNPKHNITDEIFADKLKEHFNTDKFVVYNGAFGGGKQPQQYFKYLYLDMLGFKPDIVINLDGFNEMVLPNAENIHYNNPAAYPRAYSIAVSAIAADRSCVDKSNLLIKNTSSFPLRELLNWIYISSCDKRFNMNEGVNPWWAKNFKKRTMEQNVLESIAIWREASDGLGKILKMNHIPYIHAIQPNQYVPNSKVFTEKEKKLLTYHAYGNYIEKYYMQMQGAGLIDDLFIDQRYLFKNTPQTVYYDRCCHMNQLGMEMIADDIINRSSYIFKERLNKIIH